MKKIILTIIATVALCASVFSQTNTPPPLPPVGNPFSSILGYALDTNSTLLASETLELRVGTSQAGFAQSGSSDFGSAFGGSFYFAKNFGVGGEVITKDIAGDVINATVALEVTKPLGNMRFTGFVGGGYNLDVDSAIATVGGRVSVIPMASTTRVGVYTQLGWDVKLKNQDFKPATRVELGVFYPF